MQWLLRPAVLLQRCVAAAKATFKSIAVAEPRVRADAKAGLMAALEHRFELTREAALARAAAGVDAALLSAAQQITTVRIRHGMLGVGSWEGRTAFCNEILWIWQ